VTLNKNLIVIANEYSELKLKELIDIGLVMNSLNIEVSFYFTEPVVKQIQQDYFSQTRKFLSEFEIPTYSIVNSNLDLTIKHMDLEDLKQEFNRQLEF